MAIHAVVRTDNMSGTDVRADLVSIEYLGANGSTPTDIDNGNVLKVGDLMTGEREIFKGAAVASGDTLDDIVLIATPEMEYDPLLGKLTDFYNKAGTPCRGYRIRSGNIFSLTVEAFANEASDAPVVGDLVEITTGTKFATVTSQTSGSLLVGKVIAIDVVGALTYYVVKVD